MKISTQFISNTFCEEDIDQILERRTQKIRHDNSADKGSIFSKASFTAGVSDNIDINDPDFWDKVAAKAQFEIIEELDENEMLIVNEPRMRKQVQKYYNNEFMSDNEASEDESNHYFLFNTDLIIQDVLAPLIEGNRRSTLKVGPNDPKLWTQTERSRFERMLMLHGFEGLDKTACIRNTNCSF